MWSSIGFAPGSSTSFATKPKTAPKIKAYTIEKAIFFVFDFIGALIPVNLLDIDMILHLPILFFYAGIRMLRNFSDTGKNELITAPNSTQSINSSGHPPNYFQ